MWWSIEMLVIAATITLSKNKKYLFTNLRFGNFIEKLENEL